jgi:hypothetical protein
MRVCVYTCICLRLWIHDTSTQIMFKKYGIFCSLFLFYWYCYFWTLTHKSVEWNVRPAKTFWLSQVNLILKGFSAWCEWFFKLPFLRKNCVSHTKSQTVDLVIYHRQQYHRWRTVWTIIHSHFSPYVIVSSLVAWRWCFIEKCDCRFVWTDLLFGPL